VFSWFDKPACQPQSLVGALLSDSSLVWLWVKEVHFVEEDWLKYFASCIMKKWVSNMYHKMNNAVCTVVTVACSMLWLCGNKMCRRLFGPNSNGISGKTGILSDNLTGCIGLLLLLGEYDVLQKGIQSFTEFWSVFMLVSMRKFVKFQEESKLVNGCSFQWQISLLVTVKLVGSASRDLVN